MVLPVRNATLCKMGAPTTCDDGHKNGAEASVDCGGDCGADSGTACAAAFVEFKGACSARGSFVYDSLTLASQPAEARM